MKIVIGDSYRHRVRGGRYVVIGRAAMQINKKVFGTRLDGHEEIAAQILEKLNGFVVYRCVEDDSLWVRPESQFVERFEYADLAREVGR